MQRHKIRSGVYCNEHVIIILVIIAIVSIIAPMMTSCWGEHESRFVIRFSLPTICVYFPCIHRYVGREELVLRHVRMHACVVHMLFTCAMFSLVELLFIM